MLPVLVVEPWGSPRGLTLARPDPLRQSLALLLWIPNSDKPLLDMLLEEGEAWAI
jgi:hypothetical protein